jgi:HEAT repeat protein
MEPAPLRGTSPAFRVSARSRSRRSPRTRRRHRPVRTRFGRRADRGRGVGVAQPADDARTPDELLSNFIHFVKIARYDVAAGEAAALLDSGLTEEEFVDLVDASGELDRFQSAVAQALRVDGLEEIAGELNTMYRNGQLKRARNPEQIARNIDLLGGNVGEALFARNRLVAAGEYAAPQLLEALIGGGPAAQRARVQQVLIESGRQSVAPLSEALVGLESPASRERILEILAAIRYPAALPAILTVYNNTESDAVRSAAARAVIAIGGSVDDSPAEVYTQLAEGYYNHREELTSFPGEAFQLIWSIDPGQGLTMRAVPSEIYHESMALRMAERSLRLDPTSQETLALWVASAFRREIESEGLEYVDTVYPREAMYFAVAGGPDIAQRVLARAIETSDTRLALRAIDAIESTAGVNTLTGVEGERRALVDAMSFYSRRVQIDAALAIASAQPTSEFAGSERVVPILASAIRDAGARYAIVLTGTDREEYDRVADQLSADGYEVLPPATDGIKDIASAIAEAPGIDLIVASLPEQEAVSAFNEARVEPRLAAAPMLLLSSSSDSADLQRRFGRDESVMVRRNAIDSQQFAAAVEQLVDRTLGGRIDDAEARAYAEAALGALRDLAVGRNTVLRVEDAAMPLITAIADARGDNAVNIGVVLSYMDQPRAQVALADAALDASGSTQLELLDLVASAARRFGNTLESRQINAILGLARSDDDDTAVAAATVAGALSLPNSDLVPLITGGDAERAGR